LASSSCRNPRWAKTRGIPSLWKSRCLYNPNEYEGVQTERSHGSVMNMPIAEKVTLIPICCVCHRVRDDRQNHERPTHNGFFEQWRSLRSFLRLYRIAQHTYELTHTYCARCMEQQMGQIRETRLDRSERQADLLSSSRGG
jgi:hypothetical protein